jgi:hypothetical protein
MDRASRAAWFALIAALIPASARAAGPPRLPSPSAALQPVKDAEALFNEGRRLVALGRYAEACPCFIASERLDHGVGTMLNLADCQEKNGQTASAWAGFRAAAAAANAEKQPDREEIAREREIALLPQLAHLAILPPQQGLPPGSEVHRDGILVSPWLWSSPVPVDPGDHVVVVAAPGKVDYSITVHVPKQPPMTIVARVPALQDRPAPPPKAPVTVAPPNATLHPRAKVGLALVGLGGAGVIAGALLGVKALGLKSDSATDCHQSNLCNGTGVGVLSRAVAFGNASTIAFIAAGAALTGGLVLYGTAPERRVMTASFGLSRQAASVAVEATW